MFGNRVSSTKYLEEKIDSLGKRLDATIIGNDRGYNQRYQAQESAVAAALSAAEKAVNAALSAAEKAVGKAEEAANDRFEAANNVKAELDRKYGDLLSGTLTRTEYDTRHGDLVRQLAEQKDALAALRTDVAVGPPALQALQRLSDSGAGREAGTESAEAKALRATNEKFNRMTGTVYALAASLTVVVGLAAAHVI